MTQANDWLARLYDEHALFRSKSPYTLFGRQLFPAVAKVAEKAVLTQAALDMPTIACGLERHFVAQGDYPATLDTLVPRFIDRLPPDPVNQQPFRYRLEAQDRFLLYSLGLNFKDNQGSAGVSQKGHPIRNVDEDDWVWRSPAG